MPPSKSYDREGKTRDVRAFMRANPGVEFAPSDVARRLGITSHAAAEALRYLADRAEILKRRNPKQRNGPGSVTYKGLAVIQMADDDEEQTA